MCVHCMYLHLNTLYVLYFQPLYLNVVLQDVSVNHTFACFVLYISCTVKYYLSSMET